jgi:hypothetical protein
MAGIDRLLAEKSRRGSRAIPHIGVAPLAGMLGIFAHYSPA